jgi:hypothetical protein
MQHLKPFFESTDNNIIKDTLNDIISNIDYVDVDVVNFGYYNYSGYEVTTRIPHIPRHNNWDSFLDDAISHYENNIKKDNNLTFFLKISSS